MKAKLIILVVLVFVCRIGFGQGSVNQLFNEFSKCENTTKVNIGKITMAFASLFENTMGVDGIEVIAFDDCNNDLRERFKEAVRSLKDSSFETLVNASENGARTKIMIRIKDDMIRELVVLTSGNDPAMVRIKGKIKKSDIEKLVNDHS